MKHAVAVMVLTLFLGISTPSFAEDGQALFAAKMCAACHMMDGTGNVIGPDLSKVGGRLTADQIKSQLKLPRESPSPVKMPPFVGSDAELDALVQFLSAKK